MNEYSLAKVQDIILCSLTPPDIFIINIFIPISVNLARINRNKDKESINCHYD